MDVESFVKNDEIKKIVREYVSFKKEKEKMAYNLFTVSSYKSYLENFHSDILASLLNPKGHHNQEYRFLHLFINYLNKYYDANLLVDNFQDSIVTRELGRLDIWIRDEKSLQSIIIENKINNADDMDEQIDRYFAYSEKKQKYVVQAIVYLSLDGTKHAPPTIEDLGHLVKNIGAFTNEEIDLVNGWLSPCFRSATNEDSSSFIYQYIKLIKHLANKNMDTNTMESLYTFLSTHNGMETVNTLVEMGNRMPSYRVDRLLAKITNYAPFRKIYRFKENASLFEDYRFKNCSFKLDVWFEPNGNASIVFWNTTAEGPAGREMIKQILNGINMLSEFEDEVGYNANGFPKYFFAGDKKTMEEVDNAVYEFVLRFMKNLKNFDEKKIVESTSN